MENKLQQLTEKLYNEGLSKGRADADALLLDAKNEAAKTVADAKAQAQKIIQDAQKEAEALQQTTRNEIRMASQQMSSALRQQIGQMLLSGALTPQVSAAWSDGTFLKTLVLEAVKAIDPAQGLKVVFPAGTADELLKQVSASIAKELTAGVEVTTDSRVKTPFRIVPADGGYYISFTDRDFDLLFQSYLRPRVNELLFGSAAEQTVKGE